MAKKDKKKGLFGKAVDALSSRDEKEEIEELQAQLEQAKKDASAAKSSLKTVLGQKTKAKKDKDEAEQEATEAQEKIAELEAKLEKLLEKEHARQVEKRKEKMADRIERRRSARGPKIIAKHTVESNNQTLSHVALKYYKHATPPYWKYLLEHNSEVLDGSEKNIRQGMVLEIPELPDDLKD
jgi:chromosome segregation ATPase